MRVIDRAVDADTALIDEHLARRPGLWVGVLAGLGLFLELAVIRWHGGLFPALAFFKNMSMFSCFLGLGIGYALASRRRAGLFLVPTLLLVAFGVLVLLGRLTPLRDIGRTTRTLPLFVGLTWSDVPRLAGAYAFTLSVFVGNALVFIPIGQATGRLMNRMPTLDAYGWNLLGSVAGVLSFFGLAALWTPPAVWVLAAAVVLAAAARASGRIVVRVMVPAALLVAALHAPGDLDLREVYGPYQLVTYTISWWPRIYITANHAYQQRIPDPDTEWEPGAGTCSPYDVPYRLRGPAPRDVAVVAAGSGNDVAVALHHLNERGLRRIDAVEIDPVVADMGWTLHPAKPYEDQRVRVHVTDARAFFRSVEQRYDLIVFGLLDAHTALSSYAGFRMDTFVYTVESFRDAARLLRPGGHIFMMFETQKPWQVRRISAMFGEALGHDPLLLTPDPGGLPTVFLIGKDGTPDPAGLPEGWMAVPAETIGSGPIDLPTDDWPFMYVRRRHFPISYVPLIGVFLAATGLMVFVLVGRGGLRSPPGRPGPLHFFFLGAAFMLIEAKGITELALTFGSTWQVVGAIIVGVLLLAFVGNVFVASGCTGRRVWIWYVLLVASIVVGYLIPGTLLTHRLGGGASMKALHVLLLTLPMLFASVIFSTGFRDGPGVERVLSANLFGAICGGFAEYGAVALGYRNLYLIALGFYLLSWGALWLKRRAGPVPVSA